MDQLFECLLFWLLTTPSPDDDGRIIEVHLTKRFTLPFVPMPGMGLTIGPDDEEDMSDPSSSPEIMQTTDRGDAPWHIAKTAVRTFPPPRVSVTIERVNYSLPRNDFALYAYTACKSPEALEKMRTRAVAECGFGD